jgi:hypothetical protein
LNRTPQTKLFQKKPSKNLIRIVTIFLLITPFLSIECYADGPPWNFEIPAASYWSGSSEYRQTVVLENTGMVKWSFESDVPLDCVINDPEGQQIDSVVAQNTIVGTFSVNRVGTYSFIFQNKYNQVAHVSLNAFYVSSVSENDVSILIWIGLIVLVIIIIIIILLISLKKFPLLSKGKNQYSSQGSPQFQQLPIKPPSQQSGYPPINQYQYINQEQRKICQSCGSDNVVDSMFCSKCGKPF